MAAHAAPTLEDEFLVLPIQMPAAPSFPHAAIHEVRVRRNTPRVPTETDHRTLFLKNVPVDSTEQHLRALFTCLVGPGRFEAAFFEGGSRAPLVVDPVRATRVEGFAKKRKRGEMEHEDEEAQRREHAEAANLPALWDRRIHKSGGSALVLLADEKSVQLVLKAIIKRFKSAKYPIWGEGVPPDAPLLGGAWIASHLAKSRTRTEAAGPTQTAVRALFDMFNRREKEATALARRLRNEPDEDGFVTVTKGSGARTAPASRNEAEEARKRLAERASKKQDGMRGFYRFQLREMKKKDHLGLMSRFEEDRARVRAMKEKRGSLRPEAVD